MASVYSNYVHYSSLTIVIMSQLAVHPPIKENNNVSGSQHCMYIGTSLCAHIIFGNILFS